MGTRNLTAVQLHGEYKVAQYGQWDGYPEGQGATALEFLHSLNGEYDALKLAMSACRFLTVKEIEDQTRGKDWEVTHPWLSRDRGADVLGDVYSGATYELTNSIEFANQSLYCEWGYVIDLDAMTFEVYHGFNTAECKEGRFQGAVEDGYAPIKLLKSYPLDKLPSLDEFLADYATGTH